MTADDAGREPAGPGGVIEVRPARPAGRPRLNEPAILRRWSMTADPASGTLTVLGEHRRPQVFPLPTTGRADAVTTVCLATYHWEIRANSGFTWRMLLLDREDRLAGAGYARDYPRVLRVFPPEVFEPIKAAGIRVVSEWYDTPQALQDAHPGAVGRLVLASQHRGRLARNGLIAALIFTVVFAVIAVAIHLATH
jgi:hypothetical protein